MDIFVTVIAVIIIFSVLVLIHEWGHFVMARRAGVKVLEFGFGFPPRLWSFKKGDTTYSVNAIPIGGFVKMYGEDADNPKVIRSKRSFISKTPWQRASIICAGVIMNFFLAFVLLTAGFSFGIEPLLITSEDLSAALENGVVVTAPGAHVKSVTEDSSAANAGVLSGDELLAINDERVDSGDFIARLRSLADRDVDLSLRRDGKAVSAHLVAPEQTEDFGMTFKEFTEFPHPVVYTVAPESPMALAGIRSGDSILSVNGKRVYTAEEMSAALLITSTPVVQVLREQNIIKVTPSYSAKNRVLIANVFPGGRGLEAGLLIGDVIIAIDAVEVFSPEAVQKIIRTGTGKTLTLRIVRNGEELEIQASPNEKGVLGVALSPLTPLRGSELSLYQGNVLTSVMEVKKVKLPFLNAMSASYRETTRLTAMTGKAFVGMIKGLFAKFEVPSDVGGPVQIAVYTHTLVKEGFFALVRFAAILSLSLAVINILPIPALDGGRLLFVVIEIIRGKKINSVLESRIHGLGFVLLILLIVLVTYSDVLKIL